ncbi:hypothetical protein N9292_05260, partial [Akkermansiaceae bacterium]|nr:hypothetical protein [Akkermansiaceae bacterium]
SSKPRGMILTSLILSISPWDSTPSGSSPQEESHTPEAKITNAFKFLLMTIIRSHSKDDVELSA